MHDEFKQKVHVTVNQILEGMGGESLYMIIKPLVNLARPQLDNILEKNPEQVYNWLLQARQHIDEAAKLYEAGK